MPLEKKLVVLHSQIAVFHADLATPLNDWTDQHHQQGFTWREGSVSFRTLRESGEVRITVHRLPGFRGLNKGAVRAIKVPFLVPDDGLIEFASMADSFTARLAAGVYSLLFEAGQDDAGEWCHFTFVDDAQPEPEVLLCDETLSPAHPLLMEAQPAA